VNGSSSAADHRTGARVRASDAERDAVATELAEHLKDGRLDMPEFDERMSQAMAARTRGDLDQLLADLPQRMQAPLPPDRRGPGWPFPLVPILLFALVIMMAGVATHASGSGHPGPWYPVWGLFWLAWLIPAGIFLSVRGRRGHRSQGSG
jgi:Domain of unknown function (DUF1707)